MNILSESHPKEIVLNGGKSTIDSLRGLEPTSKQPSPIPKPESNKPESQQKPKRTIPWTQAPWGHVEKSHGSVARLWVVPGMSYKPKSGGKA